MRTPATQEAAHAPMETRQESAGPERESRSARKRRVQALQALAVELVELPPARLAAAPLDDTLRQAVEQARRMERTALRRQKLYICRLLRELGDEVEGIRRFLARPGAPRA